jgi:hypothetical protein
VPKGCKRSNRTAGGIARAGGFRSSFSYAHVDPEGPYYRRLPGTTVRRQQ